MSSPKEPKDPNAPWSEKNPVGPYQTTKEDFVRGRKKYHSDRAITLKEAGTPDTNKELEETKFNPDKYIQRNKRPGTPKPGRKKA